MSYHHGKEWIGTPIGRLGRLGRLMREVMAGLDALYRVQFEKPWTTGRPHRR